MKASATLLFMAGVLFLYPPIHAQQFYQTTASGDKIGLSSDLTNKWLSSFSDKQGLIPTNSYEADKFQKFEELLKQIEADYLYLRLDQLDPKIKEASDLLQSLWPFKKQSIFYKKLLSIELMAYQTQNEDKPFEVKIDVIQRCLALSEDPEFLSMLPQGVRQKLSNLQTKSFELKKELIEKPFENLYDLGIKRRLPFRLSQGKHFVHFQQGTTLSAIWLEIDPSKPEKIVSFSKLWSRNYFEFFEENIWLKRLKASIPSSYRNSRLIFRPTASSTKHLKLFPSLSIPSTKNKKLSKKNSRQKQNLNSTLDPMGLEKELEQIDPMTDMDSPSLSIDDQSIFKNPWFWIGVGVIAGGTGYLIYDANQPQSVTTP